MYSIARAHGDTLLPGILMVVTSLLNIALDPLFIFTLDLGIQGAPIATLVSFALGLAVITPKIMKRRWLGLNRRWHQLKTHITQSLGIALPAMAGQLMPSFAAIIATGIVAQFGTEAVAAWGLGVRIEFFSLVLVLALTMSMPPMVGRFYGAGNLAAIQQLVSTGVKVIIAVQLVLALIMLLFAKQLSIFMADAPLVADLLYPYLLIMPVSYAALGVCILMVSMSNAISQSMRALVISVLRLFACFVPLLYIGALAGGYNGLLIGAALGNLLAGVMAWKLFQTGIKKAS